MPMTSWLHTLHLLKLAPRKRQIPLINSGILSSSPPKDDPSSKIFLEAQPWMTHVLPTPPITSKQWMKFKLINCCLGSITRWKSRSTIIATSSSNDKQVNVIVAFLFIRLAQLLISCNIQFGILILMKCISLAYASPHMTWQHLVWT